VPAECAYIQAEEVSMSTIILCSDCLVAESFREKFPDRVLDDPWHKVDRRDTRSPGSMA
jgi:hypothetical protein